MPRRLIRFFRSKSLGTHFKIALVLGLFFRLLSAYFVYGPQALDDYKHGVWPAYQFFAGLPLNLPQYRSHLLVWLLSFFLQVGNIFGAQSALSQVRVMYVGLAFVSLIGIWGTYLYVSQFRSKVFAPLAIYLMAIYPLMPFISTRAFGEAVALPLVVLGFALIEIARNSTRDGGTDAFLGFICLGLATLFRFQAGLLFVTAGVMILLARRWRLVWAGLAAGILTLGLQIGIDFLSGKGFLGTLISYLAANEGGAAKYGMSPWYNTWLLILGLSLFPFSLVFLPRIKILWARHKTILVSMLVFVLAHSLVPHKEERFMYPIVGLELILLAAVWSFSRDLKWVKRLYFRVFVFVLVLLLPIASLVNSQEGEIEPPALAEQQLGSVLYLDNDSLFSQSRFKFYFLRTPSVLQEVLPEQLTITYAESALADHPDLNGVEFLSSDPSSFERLKEISSLQTQNLNCGPTQTAGSVIDRLLYRLNPKHNQRRRPTVFIICEKTK